MPGSLASGRCIGASPGYRWYPDGALGGVGNNGYSWSSSASGTNGMYLDFNTTWLNPGNANNRAHGFQVRCLQAFTGILFFTIPHGNGAFPEWRATCTVRARASDKFSSRLVLRFLRGGWRISYSRR